MFNKILVPTDASVYSQRALKTACELAKRCQAELILLHVTHSMEDYWGYTLSYGISVSQEDLRKNGQLLLEAVVEGLPCEDVKVSTVLLNGYPANIIVDQVKKLGIDLVVMGSHGHGAITGSILGSVSQRVLQRASCPVLIVK